MQRCWAWQWQLQYVLVWAWQKFEHYLLGMFSQYVITNYIGLTQVSLSFVLYIMNHAVIGCDYHTVWAEQTISSCYTQCYHLDSNSSISVACVDIPFSVYTKCIFGVACVDIPFSVYIKCIFSVAVYIYHCILLYTHIRYIISEL